MWLPQTAMEFHTSAPSETFFSSVSVSCMCLALKGPEQMGALTAPRVMSWKREDVYRAAV